MLAHKEGPRVDIHKRCVTVSKKVGLSQARKALRDILSEVNVSDEIKVARLLTILDELGNNILRHGEKGLICISAYIKEDKVGIRMVAEDRGAGIEDLKRALRPGYSEDRGMGMGLNLLKSICDDLRIGSLVEGGAYVEVWKWI